MADTRLRAWSSRCRTLRLRLEEDFSLTLTLSDCAATGDKASLSVRALHDHVVCMSSSSGLHSDNVLRNPPGEAKDAVASVP